jgi:hypothetical protein
MKAKITKSMALAIEIGIAELENSGIWEDGLSKKEIKKTYKGIEELEMLLSKIEQNKKEKENGKKTSEHSED